MKKSSFLSGFNLSLAEFHAVPAPVGKAYAASEDMIEAKKEPPGGVRASVGTVKEAVTRPASSLTSGI